jgi:carbon-monoxide dehydrogenase medium subunit
MIPSSFEYHAPKNLEDALRLLERHADEAKVLAGGHSLLPLMKLRLAAPRYVIDIGRIRALSYIRKDSGRISIGALTTHAELEHSSLLKGQCALLPETASEIGDVQVRNRGTIGGSLAHADPAADYPAAILALDAEVVLANSAGTRTVPAREFFVDMLTTQLRPGEILTEIRVPALPARTGACYRKLHQPASGFAIVGVAVRVSLDRGNKAETVAVGITGVGPKPYRAEVVEKALRGKKPNPKLLADAARHAAQGVDALSDLHASADYRKEMAAVYTRRALEASIARAQGKQA